MDLPSLHSVIRFLRDHGYELDVSKALAQGLRGEEMTSTQSGNERAALILQKYEK